MDHLGHLGDHHGHLGTILVDHLGHLGYHIGDMVILFKILMFAFIIFDICHRVFSNMAVLPAHRTQLQL